VIPFSQVEHSVEATGDVVTDVVAHLGRAAIETSRDLAARLHAGERGATTADHGGSETRVVEAPGRDEHDDRMASEAAEQAAAETAAAAGSAGQQAALVAGGLASGAIDTLTGLLGRMLAGGGGGGNDSVVDTTIGGGFTHPPLLLIHS
jgi:hypothetical protein